MFAFGGILIVERVLHRAAPRPARARAVHTPQMRSTKAQASRGSRPLRMTSRPRHIVPVLTRRRGSRCSSSSSTSMRRWPSMRVTGSTTTRVPCCRAVKPWVWIVGHDRLPRPVSRFTRRCGLARLRGRLIGCGRGMRHHRGAGDAGRARRPISVGGRLDAEAAWRSAQPVGRTSPLSQKPSSLQPMQPVARADREAIRRRSSLHRGAGVVGGRALAADLVEAVARAGRPRRPRPRRTGRRRSAARR